MKFKLILPIIAALLVCTAFTACKKVEKAPERTGNAESLIPSQPDKEHFHFVERSDTEPKTVYKKENDKEFLYISNTCERVSFVAYERTDSDAAKAMNSVLNQAYNYHRGSSDTLIEDLEVYLAGEEVDLSVFPWETKVDYACTRNDGKAISIIETTDFYSAGSLEGTTVRTYNFLPIDGSAITDIFCKPDDKEALSAMDNLIYTKLIEKYGEDSGISNSTPNSTSIIDEALRGWYFTETGIRIIFNPGSIAPIENGTFELDLAKDELSADAGKYFN